MGFEQNSLSALSAPKPLAGAIAKYLGGHEYPNILEPCCGDGIFLDVLADNGTLKKAVSVTVINIDGDTCKNVADLQPIYPNISVLCQSFHNFYEEANKAKEYDLIIGIPPYVKYQYLPDSEKASLSRALGKLDIPENKLLNEWAIFLVNCVNLLSDKGKIAFVLPDELLGEKYTKPIRAYLASQLEYITIVSFKKRVILGYDDGAVVFIGENKNKSIGSLHAYECRNGSPNSSAEMLDNEKGIGAPLGCIRAIEFSNFKEFKQCDFSRLDFQKIKCARENWEKYYVSKSAVDIMADLRNNGSFNDFNQYMDVVPGIATGSNDYFSVTAEWRKKYDLTDVTLPLLRSAGCAPSFIYTTQDWNNDVNLGDKSYLLCFPESPDMKLTEGQKTFIEFGEMSGKSRNPKCGVRDRWYVAPSVWAPDAFLTRMVGDYPRMILNDCRAVCTDELLRVKFNDSYDPKNMLLLFYNSVTFASIEMLDSIYGGAALLPGEAGKTLLPLLPDAGIDIEIRDGLCKQVDAIMRGGEEIESVLDLIDKEVLVKIIGISEEVCLRCRGIWKALRERRVTGKRKKNAN